MNYFRLFSLGVWLVTCGSCASTSPAPGPISASDPQENVFFDLTASIVSSKSVATDLEDRGFTVDPDVVLHPGQHVCQFLYFFKPNLRRVTVELCHVDSTRPKDDLKTPGNPSDQGPEWKLAVKDKLEPYRNSSVFRRKGTQPQNFKEPG